MSPRTCALMAVLFVFLLPATVSSCDDSLILALTGDNPGSLFSVGIRNFYRDLSTLGTALSNRWGNYEPLMNRVMESWLKFSNQFTVTPPDEVKDDPDWQEKVESVARMLGGIRKLILANQVQMAHDETLKLSTQIGKFFQKVSLPESKKAFLEMADAFIVFGTVKTAEEWEKVKPLAQGIRGKLASFTDVVGKAGQDLFNRASDSLRLLAEYPGPGKTFQKDEFSLLFAIAENRANEFRDLVLLVQPSVPKAAASGTPIVAPASSPNSLASAAISPVSSTSPAGPSSTVATITHATHASEPVQSESANSSQTAPPATEGSSLR